MFKNKLLTQHTTNVDKFEVLRFHPNPHKTQDDDNQNTENEKYEQHGPHQKPRVNTYARERLAVPAFYKTSAM